MKKAILLIALLSLTQILMSEEKSVDNKNKEIPEETPSYKSVSPVIEGAILAIEAKDGEKFFKEFISPNDLKELNKKEGAYEKAKSSFMASEKAGALLIALKKLKGITPVYNKEKDFLVFKEENMSALTFSRENGKWYIKN